MPVLQLELSIETLLLVIIAIATVILLFVTLRQKSQLSKLVATVDGQEWQQSQQEYIKQYFNEVHQKLESENTNLQHNIENHFADLRMKLMRQQSDNQEKSSQALFSQIQSIHQLLKTHQQQLTEHLNLTAKSNREELAGNIEKLTNSTDKRLQEISGQVDKRLSDGFEKTTQTFNDILKRLALIDDAQKKITELSTNVVSLQEVLADKRSRGAFGEVQLNALIRNVLPENQFSLQHTLSNGKIADCILFLPKPTGNVVVDAKFPLESYQTMTNPAEELLIRKTAEKQFKQDIKKHINDISSKYLIDQETADGAVMFIPAEAVFAEIHAHHSDLVELANKKRVWLASPTTLMAILTTARAVIKDEATRQQVHIIQAHLGELAQDFDRFKGRFNNLARHIDQAATDVKQIHTSANKITNRFEKIEQVELEDSEHANKIALKS